jgi:hypothetical protein
VSHSESPSVPLYTIAICWLTVQQLPLVLFISGLVFRLADEGAGQQATSKSEPVFRTVMSPAVAVYTGCFGDCSATGAEQVLSLLREVLDKFQLLVPWLVILVVLEIALLLVLNKFFFFSFIREVLDKFISLITH